MDEFLFIGGTHDGERLSLQRGYPTRIFLPVRLISSMAGVTASTTIKQERYESMKFTGDGTDLHIVFAITGMGASEVMERLISGYKRG